MMNERIKQLAEQAGITTNLDTDYFEKDSNKWVDYYSDKFAELIVRECIDVVSQCNLIGVDPIAHIKVHFGVK
jgi:hypothetical protein